MFKLSGMQGLPDDAVVPSFFNPSKVDEYQLKADQCQKLKNELILELKRSNLTEFKELLEKRGNEFLTEMFSIDPWENVENKNKSILEFVLKEMNFNFPDEILLLAFNYYVAHSEQAKTTNMNLLHVLARNCGSSSNLVNLLKRTTEERPDLLKARMKLNDNLDMTPVEMVIRTSYNEGIMNFMLTKYLENVGSIASDDKNKLLFHAKWLSDAGIYSTELIGERLITRIEMLPEVSNS